MNIEYLQYLRDNPSKGMFTIEPISLAEIEQLEQLYNNGNHFPKALRELLYLAGEYCHVLDYSSFDTQQELQEYVREDLHDEGWDFSRPFYIVDAYNLGDQFLFVYLDEEDDPTIYECMHGTLDIHALGPKTLSDLIKSRINRMKAGGNPF